MFCDSVRILAFTPGEMNEWRVLFVGQEQFGLFL